MTDRSTQREHLINSMDDTALKRRYQAAMQACGPPKDLYDRILAKAAAGDTKTSDGIRPAGPAAADTARDAAPPLRIHWTRHPRARRLAATAAVLIFAAGVIWIWQYTSRPGMLSPGPAGEKAVSYAAETAAETDAGPEPQAAMITAPAEAKMAKADASKAVGEAAGDRASGGDTAAEPEAEAADLNEHLAESLEQEKASAAAARLTAHFTRDAREHMVYPADYAGCYIEGIYLHVVVKDGRYGPFIEMIGDCSAVIFEPARYSQAELRVLMNDLLKEVRQHITSAGVDDRENQVRIGVYDLQAFDRGDAVQTEAAARFMAVHGLTSTDDLPLVLEERQPARAD